MQGRTYKLSFWAKGSYKGGLTIADLSVETLSSQQIELLSGYLDDWENISFEDKRKAADGLISSISATSDYVKIEWKI